MRKCIVIYLINLRGKNAQEPKYEGERRSNHPIIFPVEIDLVFYIITFQHDTFSRTVSSALKNQKPVALTHSLNVTLNT